MTSSDIASAVKPYADPNMVVVDTEVRSTPAAFVVDTRSQRWAITAPDMRAVLRLADGTRTAAEIAAAVAPDFPAFTPEKVVAAIDQLLRDRILHPSKDAHESVGGPVYRKSEIIGLHLEVTNACNLACRHCYVSSGTKLPDELTDAELRAVIDQLPPFSGKTIAISGGEPAVRKGCLDFVAYCSMDRGHNVDLYSNGYKLPRRFAEGLKDIFEGSAGRTRVQVSLEGATAETNDAIRGKGAFERTLATLGVFQELGLNRATQLFVCVTKQNIHEVDAVVALAERFELAKLHFSQWQRQGNAIDTPWASIAPSTEEWVAAGERILARVPDGLDVTGNFFGDLRNGPMGRFSLGNALFPKHVYFFNAVPRISPDGMIFADQFWTAPEWSLGNVRDMTLEEAFETPKFYEQLAALNRRRHAVVECQGCEWLSLCESGSPGHTYAEYETLDRKDLFCDSRKYWFNRFVEEKSLAASAGQRR